jgi:hypothetical protein
MQMADKETKRDKMKKKRNSKSIGKSEKVHKKNKPFMMIKKKKIEAQREAIGPLNKRKSKGRAFLGHFTKRSAQRIESKKKKK